jgi:hypothetical protein
MDDIAFATIQMNIFNTSPNPPFLKSEAKYLITVLKQLNSLLDEFKLKIERNLDSYEFRIGKWTNLQKFELQNVKMNSDQILKTVKAITNNKIKLKHINLSNNLITPDVCRELGNHFITIKSLRQIILNNCTI